MQPQPHGMPIVLRARAMRRANAATAVHKSRGINALSFIKS